jgi:uncharacterized protein (TIGR03435 family)
VDINTLIRRAYNVQRDQVVGPDWLQDIPDPTKAGASFDIEAKLPDGATADQVPLMLQALLAERFQLKIRKGSIETDTYALIVGPKGPKFQKKQPSVDSGGPASSGAEITVTRAGSVTSTSNGVTRTRLPSGITRIETSTTRGLATSLSVGLPVVDKTNLNGDFNIVLEIPRADISAGQSLAEMTDAHTEAVMAAVETLGLKLVRQKNPIETIVVESVNRIPTEN